MASQLPVAEGGRPGGSGGNKWLIIGAIAGVGTLALLMLKGGDGKSGTTAAGTSINAALGSIQEQNLNILGQLGASTNLLSTQMSNYNTETRNALTAMQDALTAQFGELDQHLTDSNNQLSGELGNVNNNVIAGNQALANWAASLQQQYNQIMAGQSTIQSGQASILAQGATTQLLQLAYWARQMADFTVIEAGPSDPRVQQWQAYSNQLFAQAGQGAH